MVFWMCSYWDGIWGDDDEVLDSWYYLSGRGFLMGYEDGL